MGKRRRETAFRGLRGHVRHHVYIRWTQDRYRSHVSTSPTERSTGCMPQGSSSGGTFYFNYPGSSGLMDGSVFGRHPGRESRRLRGNLGWARRSRKSFSPAQTGRHAGARRREKHPRSEDHQAQRTELPRETSRCTTSRFCRTASRPRPAESVGRDRIYRPASIIIKPTLSQKQAD